MQIKEEDVRVNLKDSMLNSENGSIDHQTFWLGKSWVIPDGLRIYVNECKRTHATEGDYDRDQY